MGWALPALAAAVFLWALAGLFEAPADAAWGGGVLYAANLRSSTVSAIDVVSGQVLAEWAVAENPHELVRVSEQLYVSNYRSDRVTTLSLGAAGSWETQTEPLPHGIAVDGAGAVWYTSGGRGAAGTIQRLGAEGPDVSIVVGEQPHALVIDAARERAYVAVAGTGEVVAVDLRARAEVRRRFVGAVAESVALSEDGARLAVVAADANAVTLLDAETLAIEWRVGVPGRPVRTVFAGGTLLVSLSTSASVAVIDPDAGSVEAVIAVGLLPDGIAVDRSGRYGYVANAGSRSISVVDVRRREVVGELPAGAGVSGLIWGPPPVMDLHS